MWSVTYFKKQLQTNKKKRCLKAAASYLSKKSVQSKSKCGKHSYSNITCRGHYKLNVFYDKCWEHLGSDQKIVLKLLKLRDFLCLQHQLCRSQTKLLGSNTERSLIHRVTADRFCKKKGFQIFSDIPETSHDMRSCEQLVAYNCSILMTSPEFFL